MDTGLVARELEMAILAKLLETGSVDYSSNLNMPAASLLLLTRMYLGEVSADELRSACQASPALGWSDGPAYRSGDVQLGGRITLRAGHMRGVRVTDRTSVYRGLLREHGSRPRPPVAASDCTELRLGARREETCEILNHGYGAPDDIEVLGVEGPGWLQFRIAGRRVHLRAAPPPGVYRCEVQVLTNANPVSLTVHAANICFAEPQDNEVDVEALMPEEPGLDPKVTRAALETFLTGLGYQRLPGHRFLRAEAEVPGERSASWLLSEAALLSGRLPARGYPAEFDVLVEGQDPYLVTCEGGYLGGELELLLEDLGAEPTQRLTLHPHRGGFRAELGPIEAWRRARGHTLWLTASVQELRDHPQVVGWLLDTSEAKTLTVNVLLTENGTLPAGLLRQHRSGRISVRLTDAPLTARIVAIGEGEFCYPLPHGPRGRSDRSAAPHAQWQAARPLGGTDFREQARERGEGGLIDLELSEAMVRLGERLRPSVRAAGGSGLGFRQRWELLRLAVIAGADLRPVDAGPLLRELGLDARQASGWQDTGTARFHLTQGGYLAIEQPTLNAQAAYLCTLYGGVIHHSQLRKLVEEWTGRPVNPSSFVAASLQGLGWAGEGYRRPVARWEPRGHRQLNAVAREALQHFGLTEAREWLRRRITCDDGRLERALQSAGAG